MLSDFLQLSYWSFIISITKSKFNYGTIEPPKSSTQHPNPNEGSFPIKFINEENLNCKANCQLANMTGYIILIWKTEFSNGF